MAVKKLTEIPTVCPCLVREVSGEALQVLQLRAVFPA